MNAPLALLALLSLSWTLFMDSATEERREGATPAGGKLKIFLLVGQSNMEGKGAVVHLERALADPERRERYAHLREGDAWKVRKDVLVSYHHGEGDHRKGGLSVGFGGKTDQIGPELGFGTVVGNRLEDPVLLIKCAWGGASLREDFLPPGSGGPGGHYERMVREVRATLASMGVDPGLPHPEIEMAGMVWFQGWNDSIGNGNPDYTAQLTQFIQDVRKEFSAPDMPVVIGELGQAGTHPKHPKVQAFREQQKAVADAEVFGGSVRYVPTGHFVDPVLQEQFDLWRACKRKADRLETEKAKEEAWAPWRAVEPAYSARTADRPYHYFGSGEIFYSMGEAFGEAMIELMTER